MAGVMHDMTHNIRRLWLGLCITLLAWTPVFGQSVDVGPAESTTRAPSQLELAPVQRQRSLLLVANNTRIKAGDTVNFTARLRNAAQESAQFYYSVNHKPEPDAPHPASYQRRFDRPGSYTINVQANLGPDMPVLTSNPVIIEVASTEAPQIEISPRMMSVYPGASALFTAIPGAGSAPIRRYTWSGIGDQQSAGPTFEPQTTTLTPGLYDITLIVVDDRGNRTRAHANLEILARRTAPTVRIEPATLSVRQGEAARFIGQAEERELRWQWLGPQDTSSTRSSFFIDTHNLKPGQHTVSVNVTNLSGLTGSARANLEVLPPSSDFVATIEPIKQTVPWGEPAVFRDVSAIPDERSVSFRWQSPTGRVFTEPQLAVDTTELSPGDHLIEMTARLDDGRHDTVTAHLTVAPPRLSLTADHQRAQPLQVVQFTAGLPSLAAGQEYTLYLGDNAMAALHSTQTVVQHSYADEGLYRAHLATRIDGHVYESNPVEIRIARDAVNPAADAGKPEPWRAWLPFWWLPLALAAAVFVLYRLLRPAPRAGEIQVIAVTRSAAPAVSVTRSAPPKPDIRIVVVNDIGEHHPLPEATTEDQHA